MKKTPCTYICECQNIIYILMRKPTSNPRDRWFGHSVAHLAVGNPPPSETQRPSAPQHNHHDNDHDNEHGDNIFLCAGFMKMTHLARQMI